jgi:hypothetical protein
VVLALVGNTVMMSVQERVSEIRRVPHARFPRAHIGAIVIGESLALAGLGGAIGLASAMLVIRFEH